MSIETPENDTTPDALKWLALVAIVPYYLLYGVVLSDLWGWFVVPLDMPEVTTTQAAGLYLIWRTVRWSRGSDTLTGEELAKLFIEPLLLWGIGAAIALMGGLL